MLTCYEKKQRGQLKWERKESGRLEQDKQRKKEMQLTVSLKFKSKTERIFYAFVFYYNLEMEFGEGCEGLS